MDLEGNDLLATMYLGYPKSRLSVSLHYSTRRFSSPVLEYIEIGGPEPVTAGTPPPGEDDRRMAGFIKQLDEAEGGSRPPDAVGAQEAAAGRLAKEIESLPPGPFASKRTGDTFYDRENDSVRLPAHYLAEAGPSELEKGGQAVQMYPASLQKDLTSGTRTVKELMDRGLIRLDVSLRDKPLATLEPYQAAIAYEKLMTEAALEEPARRIKVERKYGLPMPAILETNGRAKYIRLIMVGEKRMYTFGASGWTPAFDGIINSLKEGGGK